MQLLDLPPELVRPIFQHVAPSFGLAELLRLRTVCCELLPPLYPSRVTPTAHALLPHRMAPS